LLSVAYVFKYNGPMQILIQIKAVLVGFFLLFFILVPACIIALPFGLDRRLKIVGPAWAFFGRNLVRYGCHAKIAVSEDHRSSAFKGTPCYGLYIANHQSYLDIPLSCTMHQAPPIMKQEVLYLPFIGWLAWISGALPVSRTKTSSRRQVFEKAKKRILKDRIGLQVYPEGTRSKDSVPRPFSGIKKTLLVFAFNEKIPVVPTSMYGTRGILDAGKIKTGKSIGIILHKEIDPKTYKSADEFANACWDVVIQGHDQLKAQLGPLNGNLS
jgi:1-acyl-sn-glycerol-3-phosphate acyltransferase